MHSSLKMITLVLIWDCSRSSLWSDSDLNSGSVLTLELISTLVRSPAGYHQQRTNLTWLTESHIHCALDIDTIYLWLYSTMNIQYLCKHPTWVCLHCSVYPVLICTIYVCMRMMYSILYLPPPMTVITQALARWGGPILWTLCQNAALWSRSISNQQYSRRSISGYHVNLWLNSTILPMPMSSKCHSHVNHIITSKHIGITNLESPIA